MTPYDHLAPFYDGLFGSPPHAAEVIRAFVQRHRPQARSVCELGCGTGSVVHALFPQLEVTGVDVSPEMIAEARKKFPRATLLIGDMRSVAFPRGFDVIVLFFDALNHLVDFADWERVFERVADHLADGGVFILDVATHEMFERRAALQTRPFMTEKDGSYLFRRVVQHGDHYLCEMRVFACRGGREYVLSQEDIPMNAFPLSDVRDALRKHFSLRAIQDPFHRRVSADSDRVYFFCTKGTRGVRDWLSPFVSTTAREGIPKAC